jgi:hypothetical protein
MKDIKIVPLILCILVLCILFIAPKLFVKGINKNVYSIIREEENSGYQGIIKMWHVVSWRTGKSAGVTYLKKCATIFEKRNLNFFVEIEGMTQSEAKQRLLKGEKPDIISYPNGFFENSFSLEKLNIDQSNILTGLRKASKSGDANYAAPYMCGGYMLFINQDMLYRFDLDNFDETGIPNYAFNECLKTLSFSEKRGRNEATIKSIGFDEGCALPVAGLIYHIQPKDWNEDAEDPYMILPENLDQTSPSKGLYHKADVGGGYLEFTKETTAMLVGTQDTYGRLSKLSDQGKGCDYMVTALSNFTDSVQYLSIFKTEDKLKKETLSRFIEFLQSEQCQRKLEDLYVFPVIKIEDMYLEDYLYKSIYEMQSEDIIAIPVFYDDDYLTSIKGILEGEFKALSESSTTFNKNCLTEQY